MRKNCQQKDIPCKVMKYIIACLLTQVAYAVKPHVFLVLVDDWGWNDAGYHRVRQSGELDVEISTPNIDNLVGAGIELNRHYTYNFCAPTRASLQSGRLPVHVSVHDTDPLAFNPEDPVSGYSGIPRNMTGIAQQLKTVGYRTHMTGKWDAGMATWEHTPMGRGYETFFGYYHHANDYYDQSLSSGSTVVKDLCYSQGTSVIDLWNTTGPASTRNGTEWEEFMFTENSLNMILNHDTSKPENPLFLFHSFHIVHTPLQVPSEFEKRFSFLKNVHRRKYAAMVEYMDHALGLMVNAFQKKGMWDNTVMILSSDNGGPIYGSPVSPTGQGNPVYGGATNLPLRGGKTSDWEGGIRVNAFVSGGMVPVGMRGTVLDEYVHVADWYATICEAAGIQNVKDDSASKAGLPGLDSVSQWPLITGKTQDAPRKEIHISKMTVIQGDYKLVTGGDGAIISIFDTKYMPFDCHGWGWGVKSLECSFRRGRDCSKGCLFNIKEDPNEDNEITKSHPELRDQLLARLKELNQDNFEPNRGEPYDLGCTVAIEKYHGFYGPFIGVTEGEVEYKRIQVAEMDLETAYFQTVQRI